MTNNDIFNLLTTLISGVIGGTIVALVNHLLTRRKTEAEIRKLEAETKKIIMETKVIVSDVENLSATVSYKLSDMAEQIIYDSAQGYDPHAFRTFEGQFWSEAERRFTDPKGTGTLTIEKSKDDLILNIHRTNTEGRFEVWLEKFLYNGRETEIIPKNELISGKRKLRVSCQAKVLGGEHSLRFVIRDAMTGQWLTNTKVKISKNEWTPVDLYFRVSPEMDTQFRIDDEEVSKAPSSVQIRRLVIAERITH